MGNRLRDESYNLSKNIEKATFRLLADLRVLSKVLLLVLLLVSILTSNFTISSAQNNIYNYLCVFSSLRVETLLGFANLWQYSVCWIVIYCCLVYGGPPPPAWLVIWIRLVYMYIHFLWRRCFRWSWVCRTLKTTYSQIKLCGVSEVISRTSGRSLPFPTLPRKHSIRLENKGL